MKKMILIAFLFLALGASPLRADSISWNGSSLDSHIEYIGGAYDDPLNFGPSTPPGTYSTSVSVGSSSAAGSYVFANSGFTASLTASAANSGNANLAEDGGFLFFTPNTDVNYSFSDSFSGSGTDSSANWEASLYDVTSASYLAGPISQGQSNIGGSFAFGPFSSIGSLKAGDQYELKYFADVLPPVGSTNGGISGTDTLSLTFTGTVAPLPNAAWAAFVLIVGSAVLLRCVRRMGRQWW